MSVFSGDETNGSGNKSSSRWEGYSNYQAVSNQITQKVADAIEAYAILQSAAREGADLEAREYMEARARILDAAISLKHEIEREAAASSQGEDDDDDDIYVEIARRWNEGDDDMDVGYIAAFLGLSFRREGIKGWVFTFVQDIRRAAWELGYLQAGRTISESDLEPADEDARAMFE